MKLFSLLLISLMFYGCGSTPTVERPPDRKIFLEENLTLQGDVSDVTYYIEKNGVVLDLNGYKIWNQHSGYAVRVRANNAVVKNGIIAGSNVTSGVYFTSCMIPEDIDLLANSTYGGVIRDRCTHSGTVTGVRFVNVEQGVYVANYVTDILIHGNQFISTDRMGVYLDAGSQNSTISNNLFKDNGYRRASNGRMRGDISIDSSQYNLITANRFEGNTRRYVQRSRDRYYPVPAIEVYRNYGEPFVGGRFDGRVLPREGANYNEITNNTFTNQSLGIHFQYREQHPLGVGWPDIADSNRASGNTFVDTDHQIFDDGKDNQWMLESSL